MASQPQPQSRLAFGPFELNAATGELYKNGLRIRLSAQPVQILLFLCEHAGEVIGREQLQRRIRAVQPSSISSMA